MGEVALWDEEEGWRCRKHPSQPRYGVCPACLRDRLLLLCPDCANVRPCGCFPLSSSSSSAASSVSSLSSADHARFFGGSTGIGVVGRVANLIESEPAFRRSRSLGFHLLRSRSVAAGGGEPSGSARPLARGARGWAAFWPFSRRREDGEEEVARRTPVVKLSRSRSVGVVAYPDSGRGGGGGGGRGKGWAWHFPSPMKAFRHRKSTSVAQQRSPLSRG